MFTWCPYDRKRSAAAAAKYLPGITAPASGQPGLLSVLKEQQEAKPVAQSQPHLQGSDGRNADHMHNSRPSSRSSWLPAVLKQQPGQTKRRNSPLNGQEQCVRQTDSSFVGDQPRKQPESGKKSGSQQWSAFQDSWPDDDAVACRSYDVPTLPNGAGCIEGALQRPGASNSGLTVDCSRKQSKHIAGVSDTT